MVELTIAVVLTSLIVSGLMVLYTTGLRSSSKGLDHLNNMNDAAILMSRIEYDLLKAVDVSEPGVGKSANGATWQILTDIAGSMGAIEYRMVPEGILRIETIGGIPHSHIFCRNKKANISFDRLSLEPASTAEGKNAFIVALNVADAKFDATGDEEFEIIRLISWRSQN
jgi:hypothetical protein